MRALIAVAFVAAPGCTLVYNSQYDDRAAELEEFRREILGADLDIRLVSTGRKRLYWVDHVRPDDENQLHSFIPDGGAAIDAIDYTWSKGDSDDTVLDYHFTEDTVVECGFGTANAFSATEANTGLGNTGFGGQDCAIGGNSVYFLRGGRIDVWVPSGPPPNPEPELPVAVDFALSGISGTVDAFGVSDTGLVVFTEAGGDIYTLDLTSCNASGACTTTWLENEAQVAGEVFFDDKRVIFETINSDGPHLIDFATKTETSFTKAVADGGYHLNFKHGDIHEPVSSPQFFIHDDHVIYRGLRGIFAWGIETGKVIDLLLDRGDPIEPEIRYIRPVVTADGFMYVQSERGFSERGPVFEVDLGGRLPKIETSSKRSTPGSPMRRLRRSRTR